VGAIAVGTCRCDVAAVAVERFGAVVTGTRIAAVVLVMPEVVAV